MLAVLNALVQGKKLFAFAGSFELSINPGQFTDSEIIVMLGENGTGKTTFIRMLAGRLEPDDGSEYAKLIWNVCCVGIALKDFLFETLRPF